MKLRFTQYFLEIFSLDLRSLAIYRIFIGIILFINLVTRAIDVKVYYSNQGVLPLSYILQHTGHYNLSLHFISDLWQVQFILISIACLFSLMLTIGYKTQLSIIISWVLFLSLFNRNIWINSGADQLLRLLLFWSIFLPLGARFSFDSLHYDIKKIPTKVFSLATIAFILQLNFVYLFAAIWKFDPIWIKDGTAIYYALQNHAFITPFGQFLNRNFLWSFQYLTKFIYSIEAFGFFFLYSPYKTSLIRTIAIFCFIGMHIGMGLSMQLDMFPFICIAAFTALLPSYFWEKLTKFHNYFKKYNKLKLIERFSFTRTKTITIHHKFQISKITSIFIFFSLVYVLIYNILTVPQLKQQYLKSFLSIGSILGLQQAWGMFAPPHMENNWYVIPGKLKNNTYVDLYFYGYPVNFDDPISLGRHYKNLYEARYLLTLTDKRYPYFAMFLCKKWNETHENEYQLQELKMYYMHQKIRLDGKKGKIYKSQVYQWVCQD